jgi:hypothetical protein
MKWSLGVKGIGVVEYWNIRVTGEWNNGILSRILTTIPTFQRFSTPVPHSLPLQYSNIPVLRRTPHA